MLDTPLEGVTSCYQFTGLGVFYTYFLSFTMAFNLPPIRAVYSAALGAVLVYFTGNYELSNRKYFEPKTVIIYSLYMQSFCSASVAACFLADAHIEKPYLLQQLPKISVTLFFISFYFTRISSVFYFRILAKSGKCQDNVSIVSWIVTVILLGFKVSGYEEYHKSLGITIGITFGFLHLTIAFFVNEQVPKVYGLTENEILKLFGFCSLRNLIRYEDHRTFTCSEGTQLYFRNLTTGKVAIDISFSNPEDRLTDENFSRRFIRGRGHLRIEVKRGENIGSDDRLFVHFARDMEDLDDVNTSGFLIVYLDF